MWRVVRGEATHVPHVMVPRSRECSYPLSFAQSIAWCESMQEVKHTSNERLGLPTMNSKKTARRPHTGKPPHPVRAHKAAHGCWSRIVGDGDTAADIVQHIANCTCRGMHPFETGRSKLIAPVGEHQLERLQFGRSASSCPNYRSQQRLQG